MSSIFGDDTITPPPSPFGQEEPGAGSEAEEQDQYDGEGQHEELEQEDPADHEEEADNQQDPEEDNPEGGELILGKFKSPEDLAKAYKNLERAFHTKGQPPSQQQPAAQQTTAPAQVNPAETFWNAFQQDPISTMQFFIDNAVNQRTAPIEEQRQTDSLIRNIEAVSKEYQQINAEGGLDKLFDKVQEIASELGNSALAKNPSQRILRMAAAEAFPESRQQLYNKAKSAGRQEAEEARQSKRNLGAPTGAKPKPNQPLSEVDQIKQGILAAGRRGGLFG